MGAAPPSGGCGAGAMIAVLGAGPAGCAAAIALARAGRRVLLLERQAVPRESVCGEFLGPDALAALAILGVAPAALGAVPLHRLRVAQAGREAALDLPFPACALPRQVLDGALREAAVAAGAELRTGVQVTEATPVPGGWRLRWAEGEAMVPRLLLATGKHALRSLPRLGAPRGAVGLKLHLDGVAAGEAVTLLPFPGGYAGLQPLPDGGANLCAALWDAPPQGVAAFLARVAEGSALAARLLDGARPRWEKPLAVGGLPYGWRQGAGGPEGLYRLGDQAAVIPSFTGAGVALALHSGLAVAEAIAAGASAADFHAVWARRIAGPMRWAGLGAAVLRRAPWALVPGAALAAGRLARATRLA
ncbi:FAD-dependent monooxygenase [Siccirubricoccus sp. KC 17139]|uniref:FAD-dependent monooxygenase n=1 Tax=Siccirubricoccus soli TaxID=2899147 RepID=A0ABT1D215_9PROT|nr:FAD-dependent monooxygenase [Siccirubricoccus soli]MCO6415345.1 FAD-dependent monooxygenase [Siccirubricoccus soli]MCP2681477.1 FAD-dependent monooxygenase [Siccirubricoccus soli]